VILRCWCGALSRLDYQIAADGEVTFDGEPVEVRCEYVPLTPAGEEQTMSTIKVKDTKGHEIELAQETVLELATQHAPKEPVELAALQQTVKQQGDTIKELADKNAALELAARTRDAEGAFDKLLRAGKVDPKQKDALVKLALTNHDMFVELTSTMPVIRELGVETGSAGEASARTVAATQMDLAVADEQKADPTLTREQAYARALQKNPKLYGDLVQ
jgi:hypothetical protein